MIGITVDYKRLTAIVDPVVEEEGVLVAEVNYSRVAAIIDLQDAQGWKLIDRSPRYRAEVDRVDIVVSDIYSLVVDKIDLSDDVITSDQVTFQMNKAISDSVVSLEIVAFSMNKPFSDNVIAGDDVLFSMNKPFSDNIVSSDSVLFSMNKGLSDDVIASDNAVFNMITDDTGDFNSYAINETGINNHSQTIKVF